MTVVGIMRVDITNENGSVRGYKYFCTEKRDNVAGYATDSFFASDSVLASLPRDIELDDEVVPVYPRESRRLRTVVLLNA